MIWQPIRQAAILLAVMTALLGVAYPLAISAVSLTAFASQAEGSLVREGGQVIGSSLIGQAFSEPGHFWSRPSATAPQPYNGLASGGSNLGPLNPALLEQVRATLKALHDADPDNHAPVPADLVSASASGLDPEISLAAANYQVARIARARGLSALQVQALLDAHQRQPLLGFLGERRVNVLELNLALDRLH